MNISAGATVRVLGMVFTATQLILIAIAAVALTALHGLLRYTRLGKAMRATASDPELARNCGVQTRRVIDGAWLLSEQRRSLRRERGCVWRAACAASAGHVRWLRPADARCERSA